MVHKCFQAWVIFITGWKIFDGKWHKVHGKSFLFLKWHDVTFFIKILIEIAEKKLTIIKQFIDWQQFSLQTNCRINTAIISVSSRFLLKV